MIPAGKIGDVDATPEFKARPSRARSPMFRIGGWTQMVTSDMSRVLGMRSGTRALPIFSMGAIRLGSATTYVGVVQGYREVFFGSQGKVWLAPIKLDKPIREIHNLDLEALRVLSDAVRTEVIDKILPPPQVELQSSILDNYHQMVKEALGVAVAKAVARGAEIDLTYLAKGIGADWTEADLVRPTEPTMKHAIYACLVAGLPVAEAGVIIEMASVIEFGLPLLDTYLAQGVYTRAVRALSALTPEWAIRGILTRWDLVGTIEKAMEHHWLRVLNEAASRNVPLEHAAGADTYTEVVRDAFRG